EEEAEETEAAEAASAPRRRRTGARGGASPIMQEMISVMRDSMRDTYAMLARRMELFQGLSPETVAKIFAKGMTLEFEAGHTLFEKGDPGKGLFVILGGKVDIMDGHRRIATLSRGDMFGEMALISNEPRSASAIATETTSVLVLTFDVFDKVLPKETALQLLINIVITLSERLRAANIQIGASL
ncbi:MAG TPA: cyclic nucleotide-binding domain-containing protein, partial [Candidatus Hydrogenedentes bacterium]|nr:cyclic nucleotide-binding domain-containing protein [Candidatus Hydrogenedentota bacterium]